MHWIHHGEDDGSSDDATNIDHEESNINMQVEDELDETVGILHDLWGIIVVKICLVIQVLFLGYLWKSIKNYMLGVQRSQSCVL